jgi:hypothetical protein
MSNLLYQSFMFTSNIFCTWDFPFHSFSHTLVPECDPRWQEWLYCKYCQKIEERNLIEEMNRPYEFWYYFSACEGLNFVISHRRPPSVTSIKSSLHATYSIHPNYLSPLTKVCKNVIVCCRMYTLKVSWQMHKAGCKFIGKLLHHEHKQDKLLQILNVCSSEIKTHQHVRNTINI